MGDPVRSVLGGSVCAGLDGVMTDSTQSNQTEQPESSANFKSVVSELDSSLVETVLKYAEAGDREAASRYMSALTLDGVHRMAEIMGMLYDLVIEQGNIRYPQQTVVTVETTDQAGETKWKVEVKEGK